MALNILVLQIYLILYWKGKILFLQQNYFTGIPVLYQKILIILEGHLGALQTRQERVD